MKVRLLLDENLPPRLKVAILRFNPAINVQWVGDSDTLPLGTLDPELLRYLQLSQWLLVTNNRKSMPQHLEAHWAAGGHIWGLFWLRHKATISKCARCDRHDLTKYSQKSSPEEVAALSIFSKEGVEGASIR